MTEVDCWALTVAVLPLLLCHCLILQAGNDFLPNVPSIDIYDKPCGLDLLFTAYKALLLGMGGHLTSGGTINRSRLVQLLVFLARDEEAAYKRRAVRH